MEAHLYLITLFYLSPVILTLAENIISIDCGSTGSYVDSNDVKWVGDKGFVTTGEPMKIPDVVTKTFNTLRYFPTGQTNCYTNIPATKDRKTLVRTKFYYGNYDGKFSPPSFDVIYDGKIRISVQISAASLFNDEAWSFSEVIFAPANENISVCLYRTSPSYDPFISSIEVYNMDTGMYADLGPHEGLVFLERIAYGAKELISYPLDPYGRLWSALGAQGNPSLTDLTTSAPSIDITGGSNKPPEIVMSKALSGDDGLKLSYEGLPSTGISVYLVLYFSEPQSLGRTQRRSFNVFLDKTQVGSGPIVPVFGKVTQFILRDVLATSASQIVFQSTDDSDLPPLINGLELYSISNSSRDIRKDDSEDRDIRKDDYEDFEATRPQKNNNGGGNIWINGGSGPKPIIPLGPKPQHVILVSSQASLEPGTSKLRLGSLPVELTTLGKANANGGKKKKNKLPLILGVTFASAFAILSSGFGAIFLRKRQNTKPQSNITQTTTTATGNETGTGMSPLVGQQFVSDTNDSYVIQDEHH